MVDMPKNQINEIKQNKLQLKLVLLIDLSFF